MYSHRCMQPRTAAGFWENSFLKYAIGRAQNSILWGHFCPFSRTPAQLYLMGFPRTITHIRCTYTEVQKSQRQEQNADTDVGLTSLTSLLVTWVQLGTSRCVWSVTWIVKKKINKTYVIMNFWILCVLNKLIPENQPLNQVNLTEKNVYLINYTTESCFYSWEDFQSESSQSFILNLFIWL